MRAIDILLPGPALEGPAKETDRCRSGEDGVGDGLCEVEDDIYSTCAIEVANAYLQTLDALPALAEISRPEHGGGEVAVGLEDDDEEVYGILGGCVVEIGGFDDNLEGGGPNSRVVDGGKSTIGGARVDDDSAVLRYLHGLETSFVDHTFQLIGQSLVASCDRIRDGATGPSQLRRT